MANEDGPLMAAAEFDCSLSLVYLILKRSRPAASAEPGGRDVSTGGSVPPPEAGGNGETEAQPI